MNSVSTPESERFIWAIWSSLSKSDTARRPFTMVDQRFGDHVAALVQVEEGLGLLRIADCGDHDLVKDVRRALDDFEVAVVKRVERTGNQANRHASCPSSGSSIVTSVVP